MPYHAPNGFAVLPCVAVCKGSEQFGLYRPKTKNKLIFFFEIYIEDQRRKEIDEF